jgi:hypothetical protein
VYPIYHRGGCHSAYCNYYPVVFKDALIIQNTSPPNCLVLLLLTFIKSILLTIFFWTFFPSQFEEVSVCTYVVFWCVKYPLFLHSVADWPLDGGLYKFIG